MRTDSITSFCFGFSSIASRFDPFVLFQDLRHRAWIRSLRFVSSSQTSCLDSISSFCFGFSGITPRFVPVVLFRVLKHRAQIRFLPFFRVLKHHAQIQSLSFLSGSLALLLDLIPAFFYFGFSSILPRLDPILLIRVLWHCAQIRYFLFLFRVL